MKQTNTRLDAAIQEKTQQIKPGFLKEWKSEDFKTVEAAIVNHFRKMEIKTYHGNYPLQYRGFKKLGEIMGFAYTSTGDYAGYWVCNTEVLSPKYEGYQYTGFALTEDKKPFAILWDAEENEILQPL